MDQGGCRPSGARFVALSVVFLFAASALVVACRAPGPRAARPCGPGPRRASVTRFRFFNTSKRKTLKDTLKLYESNKRDGTGATTTYTHGADVPSTSVVNAPRTPSTGDTKYLRVEATLEGNTPIVVANPIPTGAKRITHAWAHLDVNPDNNKHRLCVTGMYIDANDNEQVLPVTSAEVE